MGHEMKATYTKNRFIPKQQAGSALPISLMILLMLTILGISNMETTIREEKMASNTIDRQKAFQAAEAALRDAERKIENTTNIDKIVFYNGGVVDNNTTVNNDGDTCLGGYCIPRQYTQGFSGNSSKEDAKDCADNNFIPDRWYNCPSGTNAFNNNLNVWNDGSGRHITYSIANTMKLSKDPRYIIEFLGYVIPPGQAFSNCDTNNDGVNDTPASSVNYPFCTSDKPLYRISALGYGGSDNTRVMLQSTYLKN